MMSTRVAVVGCGIAGLGAARALSQAGLDVVVYEASPRAGGHVHTVDAGGHAIDMGFIVCNRERYPLFFNLLGELGIRTRPTTMAFSVSLPARDLEWGSANLSALFAQRRRLLDAKHWRFLVEVTAFLRRARRDLDLGRLAGSLDDYLAAGGARGDLRDAFAIPLTAALWSLPPDLCGGFPAETFIRFLDQHGMLRTIAPLAWHTIEGGSRRYVDALLASLRSAHVDVRLSTPVTRITRDDAGVTIDAERFDRVVIATHADTALSLLADPTDAERTTLGAIRYSTNRTVLHTDRSFLPRSPAAHASWNYVADLETSQVAVTYSMTRLQGLPDAPYLVTLNPRREPQGIIAEVAFTHPQLDAAALAAQTQLPRLAGTLRTYYAGAHFGFGFHEDGLRSGLVAAARLLADLAAGDAMKDRAR